MNPSIPVRTSSAGAKSPSLGDREYPHHQGLEFAKEIWEALLERGWHPKGVSCDLPHDILIQEDPTIHVICKALAGSIGWYEAIGRACFCMFSEPGARTILAVPHAGRFFEQVSYFCKKNDVCVSTPNTIADDVAILTRETAVTPTFEGAFGQDQNDVHF